MNYSKNIRDELIKELLNRIANGNRFSLTFDEWASLRNRRSININAHSDKEFWNLGLIRIYMRIVFIMKKMPTLHQLLHPDLKKSRIPQMTTN